MFETNDGKELSIIVAGGIGLFIIGLIVGLATHRQEITTCPTVTVLQNVTGEPLEHSAPTECSRETLALCKNIYSDVRELAKTIYVQENLK